MSDHLHIDVHAEIYDKWEDAHNKEKVDMIEHRLKLVVEKELYDMGYGKETKDMFVYASVR
jgi:hypothetical protein